MVLADKDIKRLSMGQNNPLIAPFRENQLQGASYDVTLSGHISIFKKDVRTIDLEVAAAVEDAYESRTMGKEGYIIQPGEYILAQLAETVTVPEKMVAHLRPRTRFTRAGLLLSAQHCNPTYSGQLYVGLLNVSPNGLKIKEGLAVGQILFESITDVPENLYRDKKNAAYMNEHEFRGAVLGERGWTEKMEKKYAEMLENLTKGQ